MVSNFSMNKCTTTSWSCIAVVTTSQCLLSFTDGDHIWVRIPTRSPLRIWSLSPHLNTIFAPWWHIPTLARVFCVSKNCSTRVLASQVRFSMIHPYGKHSEIAQAESTAFLWIKRCGVLSVRICIMLFLVVRLIGKVVLASTTTSTVKYDNQDENEES
jgi:hypothetical protein